MKSPKKSNGCGLPRHVAPEASKRSGHIVPIVVRLRKHDRALQNLDEMLGELGPAPPVRAPTTCAKWLEPLGKPTLQVGEQARDFRTNRGTRLPYIERKAPDEAPVSPQLVGHPVYVIQESECLLNRVFDVRVRTIPKSLHHSREDGIQCRESQRLLRIEELAPAAAQISSTVAAANPFANMSPVADSMSFSLAVVTGTQPN
jgi:hypothetical protein